MPRLVSDMFSTPSDCSYSTSPSYGYRGKDIMTRFIHSLTPVMERITSMEHTRYDKYEDFVDMMLIPELAAVLIAEDYDCSIEDGYHIAWLSEPFGQREFPELDSCPVLRRLQKEGARDHLLRLAAADGWQPEDLGVDGKTLDILPDTSGAVTRAQV